VKLYHGTTEAVVNAALNQGILPRADTKHKGNWNKTSNSRPDCVYLTNAYAGYFAGMATQHAGRWGIIEVDTDLIPDPLAYIERSRFLPDEDYLEQVSRGSQIPDGRGYAGLRKANAIIDTQKRTIARTRWFRDNLLKYGHEWRNSVDRLGNCAVFGPIEVEAITRISFFNPKSNDFIASLSIDPTISLMNNRLLGDRNRALMEWLMGQPVDHKIFGPFIDQAHETRVRNWVQDMSGLEVITVSHKEKMLGG
jgi:hypothetical protein